MSYTDPNTTTGTGVGTGTGTGATTTTTSAGASSGASAGQKIKGAFQAAHGLGESIRGNAMDFVDSALGTERKGQPAFERGQQETAVGVDNMHGSAPVGTAPGTGLGATTNTNTTGTETGTGTGMGQRHAVPPPVDQDAIGNDVKTQPHLGAGAGTGMQGTAGVGSKSSAPGYGSQY